MSDDIFYMIDSLGQVQAMNKGWSVEPRLKEIGNYFENKNEALDFLEKIKKISGRNWKDIE